MPPQFNRRFAIIAVQRSHPEFAVKTLLVAADLFTSATVEEGVHPLAVGDPHELGHGIGQLPEPLFAILNTTFGFFSGGDV